jgi:hypothetical protein
MRFMPKGSLQHLLYAKYQPDGAGAGTGGGAGGVGSLRAQLDLLRTCKLSAALVAPMVMGLASFETIAREADGIALLAQLFAFGAGALVLSTKDVSVSLGDSGAITQLIESTCFGACGVLFGVAIGVLFRQTVAAVIICIAWPILLESLASLAVPKDFRRYLPVDALTALLSKVQGADGSGHPLSSAAGVAVYFAWIVVLVAIGGFFMNRADTK